MQPRYDAYTIGSSDRLGNSQIYPRILICFSSTIQRCPDRLAWKYLHRMRENVQNIRLVLSFQTHDNDSGKLFRWVAPDISKVPIQCHQNTFFLLQTPAMLESARPPRRCSNTVIASWPSSRSNPATSTGRFSSTLNLIMLFYAGIMMTRSRASSAA